MIKTLEQILEEEKAKRHEGGDFGITACKERIKFEVEWRTKRGIVNRDFNDYTILFDLLSEYLVSAQNNCFFHRAMILACWEMINEKGE